MQFKAYRGALAYTAIICAVPGAAAWAQPLGVGLKLGVPATEAFKVVQQQSLASSQNFVWGPYLELRLPGGNAIEVDALRRKYDSLTAGTANTWEFPVLLKHRIGSGLVKPYFEGGAAFSRLSDIRLSTLQHRSNYGLVAGGGVEFNFLAINHRCCRQYRCLLLLKPIGCYHHGLINGYTFGIGKRAIRER